MSLMNHLTTSIVQSSVPGATLTCFDDGLNPACVSSLQLDVRFHVVIAAAIPDAMLLQTDECFAQEVSEPVYDGLNMSQICSMGYKSGLMAGQGTDVTVSLWR